MKTLRMQSRRGEPRSDRARLAPRIDALTSGGRSRVGLWMMVCVSLIFGVQAIDAQTARERRLLLNEYVSPEELISMSKTLPFDKAMSLFTDFSKKYLNKIIVDPMNNKKEIGIDVENQYWLQAFETVLRANSLWYEEKEEYFQIFSPSDSARAVSERAAAAVPRDTLGKLVLKNRDVKISSVFFDVDVVKSINAGINWSFLYNDTTRKAVQFGGDFSSGIADPTKQQQTGGTTGGQQVQAPGFVGRVIPSVNFTNISALISFFQSSKLGDVISSPQVVVSSGQEGKIQVGQDFYISTHDFAGNLVQQLQSAGIIIIVKPVVYEERGMRFINLTITAENSTIASAGASPIINRSSVKTSSVLLDGEETVIGGLYTTTESSERAGIPFLKDLPWYVFGLRYIFGYDNNSTAKKELIILLKAEIVPTLEERVADKLKRQENLIEKQRQEYERDIERHKVKR